MPLKESRKKIILRAVRREIEQLKDKKGFLRAGSPRFDRLFGRDSLISAWQLLDKSPGICKATLEVLFQTQGEVINNEREEEPGKIIHETDLEKNWHPEAIFRFPYYGSVDSTPLFLIIFSFYFEKIKGQRDKFLLPPPELPKEAKFDETEVSSSPFADAWEGEEEMESLRPSLRSGDKKFLSSCWKNILAGLNWMEEYGDRDKDFFLEYQRKNPGGLFHQGWKDSFEDHLRIKPPVAVVEAQGYQYLALKNISNLAEMKKDLDLANKLRKRAENLKEEFNKKFWMEEKQYFALALDGKKEQRKAITSNPGHLLFTGIVDKEKTDPLVRRLFKKDLWTPFGIRTHSALEPDFNPLSYHLGSVWPHDNWIIAQGLKKLGYQKEYQKIKTAILAAYNQIGYLPELYGVVSGKITLETEETPCYPQAWASGALFNFLST